MLLGCTELTATTHITEDDTNDAETKEAIYYEHNRKVGSFQESLLVHPKDKIPDLQKCGVVYQIICPQCQHLYVGETAEPWQPE